MLSAGVKEMRQLVFGGNGVPVWGTKFTEIEAEGMNVGLELGRLFMEQSVAEQAGTVPEAALSCDGEAATPTDQTTPGTPLPPNTSCRISLANSAKRPATSGETSLVRETFLADGVLELSRGVLPCFAMPTSLSSEKKGKGIGTKKLWNAPPQIPPFPHVGHSLTKK
jgi:hypothetical protein